MGCKLATKSPGLMRACSTHATHRYLALMGPAPNWAGARPLGGCCHCCAVQVAAEARSNVLQRFSSRVSPAYQPLQRTACVASTDKHTQRSGCRRAGRSADLPTVSEDEATLPAGGLQQHPSHSQHDATEWDGAISRFGTAAGAGAGGSSTLAHMTSSGPGGANAASAAAAYSQGAVARPLHSVLTDAGHTGTGAITTGGTAGSTAALASPGTSAVGTPIRMSVDGVHSHAMGAGIGLGMEQQAASDGRLGRHAAALTADLGGSSSGGGGFRGVWGGRGGGGGDVVRIHHVHLVKLCVIRAFAFAYLAAHAAQVRGLYCRGGCWARARWSVARVHAGILICLGKCAAMR